MAAAAAFACSCSGLLCRHCRSTVGRMLLLILDRCCCCRMGVVVFVVGWMLLNEEWLLFSGSLALIVVISAFAA